MIRQLTVDFNEEIDDGLILANERDAVPGTRIAVGERVIVGDDDAGACHAEIVDHDPVSGVLFVRLLDDRLSDERDGVSGQTR
ncbi:MAG: hypothetical protein ACRDYX_03960 [Egibacteraceae bacterium]